MCLDWIEWSPVLVIFQKRSLWMCAPLPVALRLLFWYQVIRSCAVLSNLALGLVFSSWIPVAYSSSLQLLPYPFKVILTFFFCLSSGIINEERGSRFRLKELEPSFKELFASPARMAFQVLMSFLIFPQLWV
jgi:hypothetical protein